MTTLYHFDEIKDPYIHRQAFEHDRLDRFVKVNNELIDYLPLENSKVYPHPPIVYKIIYKVKSIVGIDEDQMPIYGNHHEMQVKLPQDFPEQPADCKMITDTWHPNIKSEGPFKGAICTNSAGFGSLFFLDELITRIGEFLQYKRYMADERPPWPEDAIVARWVREIGEPNAIVDGRSSKYIDHQTWKDWDEILPEEEDFIEISDITGENEFKEEPPTKSDDDEIDFSIVEK